MNSEQITAFLQEHWYIASVLIGAVILIGAIRNWNWLCDPTGTRDAHRHSRGYRRVVVLPAGRPFDRGEHLGICAEIEIRGISMKLNCKRIDFTYTPGEEIFNFPEESGLPFIFDVEEELTGDPAVMDAVGEMLDEAEKLAEKAKAAIKAALADEDSRYHSVVTFFMEFHRDDVGPDIVAELFPGTDPAKLSFAEMVDFLKLKRFGSLVDSEMNQQVFILDLSFNPEITDELMVIYFDLNKEIFCITHES